MDSRYDHTLHEEKTYQLWAGADAFNPDSRPSRTGRRFSIAMPPPNANDPLHIGHAMFIALEDILIRYHRMLGDDTLWQPGTDHAGIETQFVFEKKLAKQGQSRFNFDRETLYQMIWEYVQENSGIAVNQMKKLGASADWSRFHFMLEPELVETVLETFKKLHEAGMVYRDLKLVNFCTRCGTSFSELEVNYIDQQTPLYYVRYPLADNPRDHLVLATTRPEPIFVDTHLAVHPDNPKTKHLIGKKVLNPLTQSEMEIIADEFVDPEFGTGIVKLTPAHDPNDFEVAQRHHLPIISAIDTRGRMTENGGKYAGLKVKKAREEVVKDLQAAGLIEKIDEKYAHRIGTCYRCGTVIEPLPLPQFFIKVKPLVEPVLSALDNDEITIHGAGHDKILRHWLENLKDWNVSRQIVWGVRLPVWYQIDGHERDIIISAAARESGQISDNLYSILKRFSLTEILENIQKITVGPNVPYVISATKPAGNYIQETDTFDTWFSSAQWPFSTLLANEKKHDRDTATSRTDFDRFYPTSVMETGYDILPFWVMRMLMIGKFATGRFPFHTVYLHGLVRDPKGQKMSKSKGNVINPLDMIAKYGADALRMALVIRSSPGLDKSVGETDFRAMRNLGNKIWNAARYVMNAQHQPKTDRSLDEKVASKMPKGDPQFTDKISRLVDTITQQLNDYKIGLAAETVYNEFWHWFCDECIEQNKAGELSDEQLLQGLLTFLKLLHPFVPFVTEAVWQELRQQGVISQDEKLLILSSWPAGKMK
ncbi:MAG TPA: valine--tRNA ligase [Patescibacteria group bacterium]